MYQRDRGEVDWDARSVASNDMLRSTGMSPAPSLGKSEYFHGQDPSMPSLSGYDMYMQRGPMPSTDSSSNIELARLDYNRTTDNLPLLNNNSPPLGGPNNNTYPPQQQQQRLDAPALTRYMSTLR